MQLTEQQYYSPEEYLALEEVADYKSEYIDGQIFPMTGGSTNHNQIAGNFYAELIFAFKKLDYLVYMSDVRLWIAKRRIYTYPDVMIVAGEPEYFNNRTDTIINPKVIIEVLSDSTKGYDKSGKFAAYRTLPSLSEYILIDQTKVHVEQFYKTGKKRWSFGEYDAEDEAIALNAVQFKISLDDIYNKVKFEQQEVSEECY
ncbi:Uma2 family endonuclease [Argonema antarcticum]|uniref:Uma2 family endonuclease n=1 Tax=Argonema antarcticum TaxID=2942763 RepID=UPI0020118E42|nr:Uma2 family endonuclease [Argonema antarcticum]MCL1475558.1 Uma2 family endonuclease [Argonema antarcticum A004/B2]